MTEAINSLTLICYFPTKQEPQTAYMLSYSTVKTNILD